MQAGLGVTGVDGAFRSGCENILRVSRANATNLTRLMQAVLTDPLICWSGDKRPGSKKVNHNPCINLLSKACQHTALQQYTLHVMV